MTQRRGSMVKQSWLVIAATLLTVAGCGGTVTGAGPGKGTPTPAPSLSPSRPGRTTPSRGALESGVSACELISSSDAAAALGMAVGKGQPAPGTNLANGAVGGSCTWTGSNGGQALVATLEYPSAAIARRVFGSGNGTVPGAHPVHIPDLAPAEFADTGTFSGTKIAESILLDGSRELDVTINQPASGPGSHLSLPAFVTLVQQAAQAWR